MQYVHVYRDWGWKCPSHCKAQQLRKYPFAYTVEPTTLGPEGVVQYTEKFGILKVILNDSLVKVQQVQLVHA